MATNIKTLDVIGQVRPEITERVLELSRDGESADRIAMKLFAEFEIEVGRAAVYSWLKAQPERVTQG